MGDKKNTLEERLVPPQTNTEERTERFILDMIRCIWQDQNNIGGSNSPYQLLWKHKPDFKICDSLLVLDPKGFYRESAGWWNNSPSTFIYYYIEGLEFLRDKLVTIENIYGDSHEHLQIRYNGKITYPLCVTEVMSIKYQEGRQLNTIKTPKDFERLFLSLSSYQWDLRNIKTENKFSPDFIFLPHSSSIKDFILVLSHILPDPVSNRIRKRIEQYYAHGDN